MTREQQERVEAVMPAVWVVARRHFPKARDTEDLVQVGLEAICRRVDCFDPGRGVPFHTWAGHVAWRAMQDHLRNERPGSRTHPLPGHLSLNARAENGEGDVGEFLELVAVEDDHPRLTLEDVARLPRRTARAVTLRLAGYSLAEVGEMDGVTESRISQLISAARPLIADVAAPPAEGTLLVDRELHKDERAAIREARRVRPGCQIVTLEKRKLRKGRVVAPQGRPAADGSLGRPVWAVELRDAA